MKTPPLFSLRTVIVTIASAGWLWFSSSFPAIAGEPPAVVPAETPGILDIQIESEAVVVTVRVPAGIRKVTLEARTRLGAGAWVPRAVERTDGSVTTVTFRLPRSQALEILRVRGDEAEPLPAAFYQGKVRFDGQVTEGDSLFPPGRVGDLEGGAPVALPGGDAQTRDVVESDIWVVRESRLYFFNQYRGLQIIDLSQPDAPQIRSTLPLPASGEQMYLVGEQHALLLARNGCGWGTGDGSQAIVVSVANDQASVVQALPIQGYIQESRLVGSALYVASQTYRAVPVTLQPGDDREVESVEWEWGSVVSSFDLRDPTQPVVRDSLWFAGYANVIQATDRFLFVSTYGENGRSRIQAIDISAPDGTMKALSTVTAAGQVADKFKLNLAGDVLRVVSHVWRWTEGQSAHSVLETFSLVDPLKPAKLGEVAVGRNESLFATRFDGDRAYIVTFERVDPLWIIDLKDPANPRIAGELEVPGWSTYIHPLGDRLVAVGINSATNWQVAVSLFDVSDVSKPSLLAKVPLGDDHSWSEANQDEKALTVLPEAGLILLPFQGSTRNGWASKVQLIDLERDTLTARGTIDHRMQPRRAALVGERIVSLSGQELITVKAEDRDHPKVTSTTELSWPVDRLAVSAGYLVEIANGGNWWAAANPSLRVVSKTAPDERLATLELTHPAPVTGTTVNGRWLYLLQVKSSTDAFPLNPSPEDGTPPPTATQPEPNVFLTVVDLERLPALEVVGESQATLSTTPWTADFHALWPKPGLLVWAGGGYGGFRFWGGIDVAAGARLIDGWWPWWGGGGASRFLAFDASNPAAPQFASDLDLATEQNRWDHSEAYTAGGLIFVSHQTSEFKPSFTPTDPAKAEPVDGRWINRHFLRVLDHTDPATPALRPAVNLPGGLRGVSHEGAVLYTVGPRFAADGQTDWQPYLEVLAYDGVEASLITSLRPANDWSQQSLVHGDSVLLPFNDHSTPPVTGRLETYRLTEAGSLARVGTYQQIGDINQLRIVNELLVVSGSTPTQTTILFDAADLIQLKPVGRGTLPGCYWSDLEQAAGSLRDGLWIPLGDFGVSQIPVDR